MTELKRFKKRIGKHVKHLRLSAGMSQQNLARATSLSQATIAQIETGRKTPSIDTLYWISKALQTDPSELIGRLI